MSPDPRDRRRRKKPQLKRPVVRTGPSPDDPHEVVFFKRLLVVVDGRDKPFRTTLSDADYTAVRRLGDEYRSRNPRSLA